MNGYLLSASIASACTVLAVLCLHRWQDSKTRLRGAALVAAVIVAAIAWGAAFATSEQFQEGAWFQSLLQDPNDPPDGTQSAGVADEEREVLGEHRNRARRPR